MNRTVSKYLVGIDPAGIGTTGIVIQTFNGYPPIRIHKEIISTNPVEAFDQIDEFLRQVEKKMNARGYERDIIVVELNHHGAEQFPQVKATRELIGMLRSSYRYFFRGHLPNQKSKKYLQSMKLNNYSSHIRDAYAILNAHITEKQNDYQCENGFGVLINGKKDNS